MAGAKQLEMNMEDECALKLSMVVKNMIEYSSVGTRNEGSLLYGENLTRAAEALDVSRNTDRKYL